MSLALGRDATVLFESYHPFSSAEMLGGILRAREVSADVSAALDLKYPTACAEHEFEFDFNHAASRLGLPPASSIASAQRETDAQPFSRSGDAAASRSPPRRSETEAADVGKGQKSQLHDSSSSHTLQADPFEVELKSVVLEYFKAESLRRNLPLRQAMKAPAVRWLHVAALTAAAGAGIYGLLQGSWLALAFAPLVVWVWMVSATRAIDSCCAVLRMAVVFVSWRPSHPSLLPSLLCPLQVNVWHDAAHFAMSSDWRVNALWTYIAPWFASPTIWHHQHTIGHHCYTNVPKRDPDLYHAPAMWRFQSSLRWKPMHKLQPYTTLPLWLLAVPTLLLLKPLITVATNVFNRAVVLMPLPRWRIALHLIGRALVFCSLYVWPFHFWWAEDKLKACAFAFFPISFYSLCFMISSQINHHAEELSHSLHTSWYRHQVMTSHCVAPDSLVSFFLTGGLSLQIEHHLFPGVNHWHLRALQPKVEALCKKHDVPYCKSNSIWEALGKLWHHLFELAEKPAKGEQDRKVLKVQ